MTLNYLSVKDFCKTNPTFSENSLRWIIFNADTNGFTPCIKRIGKRKILIDPEAVKQWIENQSQGGF